MTREKKSFFKYCSRCGDIFHPTGWTSKICDKCKKKSGYRARKNIDFCPYAQGNFKCTNKNGSEKCIFKGNKKKCIFLENSVSVIKPV